MGVGAATVPVVLSAGSCSAGPSTGVKRVGFYSPGRFPCTLSHFSIFYPPSTFPFPPPHSYLPSYPYYIILNTNPLKKMVTGNIMRMGPQHESRTPPLYPGPHIRPKTTGTGPPGGADCVCGRVVAGPRAAPIAPQFDVRAAECCKSGLTV